MATTLRERLPAPHLRTAGDLDRRIRTVATVGGAGDGLIGAALAAGADLYVTGDLRHHVTLDALEQGLTLIDAGHHATEAAALPAWIERLTAAASDAVAHRAGGSVEGPNRPLELTVPSDTELDLLLALQHTDHRLRKIEHQLDALPEQQVLDQATGRVDTLEAQRSELAAQLDQAAGEQRTLERDIDTLGQRRDAERVRLYDGTVTNQREMSSVEAEIETTIRRLEEHEEDLLVVMERVEGIERAIAALDGELVAARARVREAEEARDATAGTLLAERAELQVERDGQAGRLPADLLGRYEEAAARGGGTGVGKLEGLACSACAIEMSRADVDELYHGDTLATCPVCRRLLIVR